MAHELEIMENGKAAHFYVGETPWHGLGTKLENPPTVEEGIIAAGLDWRVGLKDLVTVDGQKVDHRATFRESDGKIFGVVGPGYTPLQNIEAFKWFQPLLDSGEATLHTAGSLQEGKKVWVLAKLTKPALEIAPGDTVDRFALLSGSHDGTRAVRCGFTPIRVVCANTLRMAHGTNSGLIKLLHTKNIVTSLDALREVMNTANSAFEATAEQYRKLAQLKISKADLRKYVKIILDVDPNEDEKELPGQTLTKIREIVLLADQGIGNGKDSAVNGTLWAAYNGVTEYLAYQYGRTKDRRLDANWFGPSATLSQKALDTAIAMAV
jgi:phage/plasmid-like protein (TIGR03299 family)